jgi:hypothetical protein
MPTALRASAWDPKGWTWKRLRRTCCSKPYGALKETERKLDVCSGAVKRAHHPAGGALVLLAILTAAIPSPASLHAQSGLACEACHGELEFLRQHASTLEEARKIHVPGSIVAASAHDGMACTDCHSGYRRFPHGSALETATCASCHEAQRTAWTEGIHAVDGNAGCGSCHGTHDVLTVDEMREPVGVATLQMACASCHFEPRTPPDDPHGISESCSACHEPHRTRGVGDPEASIHPLNQAETCGACHEATAAAWRDDAHGRALPHLASPEGPAAPEEVGAHLAPPSCTGCHGAHGMLTPGAPDFPRQMAERCSHCHEEYAESFSDSYHGQATELGSAEVATCYHCHGSHDVLPSSDGASMVNEANLMETCRSCHPAATEGFTRFQPHADHNDRENYPFAYWSYHLMTLLLLGTFTFFGLHTALWLVRLSLNALRGEGGHATHQGD